MLSLTSIVLRLFTAFPLIFGWRKMKISLAIYCWLNALSEVISTILTVLDLGNSGKGFVHHNFILVTSSCAIIYFYADLYKLKKYWLSLIYALYFVFFLVTQLYFFDDFFEFCLLLMCLNCLEVLEVLDVFLELILELILEFVILFAGISYGCVFM